MHHATVLLSAQPGSDAALLDPNRVGREGVAVRERRLDVTLPDRPDFESARVERVPNGERNGLGPHLGQVVHHALVALEFDGDHWIETSPLLARKHFHGPRCGLCLGWPLRAAFDAPTVLNAERAACAALRRIVPRPLG